MKDYMVRTINEQNDWDRDVKGDAVEGPLNCVSRYEVVQMLNEMKTIQAPGLSDVCIELPIFKVKCDIRNCRATPTEL